jgi:Leucine-rich repeat (LRR) protein
MTNAGDKSRVAEALDHLRQRNQSFSFDKRERVVSVYVSGTSNTDDLAAHIGRLHDLRELTFSGTDLTDCGLSHLAPLARLRKLSLESSNITAHGLIAVCSMSKLKYLHIKNARDLGRVAFIYIAQATSLRQLYLQGGGLCDADLEPLAALLNLEKLSVSKNHGIHGTFCKYLIGLP